MNIVITVKLVKALNTPIMNGQADSVSGLVHAFLKVGMAANASLIIAKAIAISGFLVTSQRIIAIPDSVPHK